MSPITSTLTHRTEAALLGTLLFDRRALDDVAFLTPTDFAHPNHQDIYRAIHQVAAEHPAATGSVMAELVAEHLGRNRIDIGELHALALGSPEPQAAAVYARLVLEAALDRELADHAARMAVEAGPIRGIDPQRDHLAQLAEAIAFHTRNIDAATAYTTTRTDSADRPELSADQKIHVQEQVLADLIQHPRVIGEVATWLEPEVFTGGRREIYETIVAVDQYGEAIDEVTLTWALGRRTALADTLRGFNLEADQPDHAPPGTISRLAAAAVEFGVAVELGRDLMTEHFRTELAAERTRVIGQAVTQPGPQIRAILAPGLTVGQQRTLTQEVGPAVIQPPPSTQLGPDGPQLRQ